LFAKIYQTPAELEEALQDNWPSLTGRIQGPWEYEWRKHGAYRGFSPRKYLQTALYFHNLCLVQEALAKEHIFPSGREIKIKRFKDALKKIQSR